MKKSYKILISAILGMIFLIGIAIPKLTVRDAFPLNDHDKRCVQEGILRQLDHTLQRTALALGKSAVVGVQNKPALTVGEQKIQNTFIVKLYTVFRIPIPVTNKLNRATLYVTCDPLTESIKEIAVSYPMYSTDGKDAHPPLTLSSAEFVSKIQSFVVKNVGQPIEGFSATVYLNSFPGLLGVDFNKVETLGGIYAYSNGKLNFVRRESNRISTADEMLVEKGYETFFNNIRDRLGRGLFTDEIIKGITAEGVGHVKGTILLGPTCPVVKDPPDSKCVGKPIFGEFIIQNAMGNLEFTRFSTDANGNFSVPLPTGEYYITWAEPQGPGIQGRLVNVLAGETSEYTITFDSGTR